MPDIVKWFVNNPPGHEVDKQIVAAVVCLATKLKRYAFTMKHLPIIICFLLYAPMTFAASEKIEPGDHLVIQSPVIGCGDTIWNIETGKVDKSGDVVFFGNLTFHVDGKSTETVSELITNAIEKKSNHRPSGIKVIKVPRKDSESFAKIMMQVIEFRYGGCRQDVPPTEVPDYLIDLKLLALPSPAKSLNSDTRDAGAG